MKVYVLLQGWDYEGEKILRIFDSEEKAAAECLTQESKRETGIYYYVEECDVE